MPTLAVKSLELQIREQHPRLIERLPLERHPQHLSHEAVPSITADKRRGFDVLLASRRPKARPHAPLVLVEAEELHATLHLSTELAEALGE